MGCSCGVHAGEGTVGPIPNAYEATTAFEQEYWMGEVIGKGAFGEVHTVSHCPTGKKRAAKLISLADRQGREGRQIEEASIVLQKARAELDAWRAVGKHPNVVELHAWFVEQPCAFIMVMEECSCTVSDMVNTGALQRRHMPWLLREMLLGVQACHQAQVVHRDIKTDNFLVSKSSEKVKLSDFGLAAQLKPSAAFLKGHFGTPPMMSPEMVNGLPYDTSTDVWSFGAMAYFMLFQELPYIPKEVSSKAAKEAIRVGKPKPRFLEAPPKRHRRSAVAFMKGLLQRDPAERATAADALDHDYLQEQHRRTLPGQTMDALPSGAWASAEEGDNADHLGRVAGRAATV